MTIDEVQHLVEQQHGSIGRREYPGDCVGARWCGLSSGPERGHALVARELAGEIDPRRLAAFRRIPCIAHEDADSRRGGFGYAGMAKQIGHARQDRGPPWQGDRAR